MINLFLARLECGHYKILSESELQNQRKGKLFSGEKMLSEPTYECTDCLDMKKGYCQDRAWHPIKDLRKLSPLEISQLLSINGKGKATGRGNS